LPTAASLAAPGSPRTGLGSWGGGASRIWPCDTVTLARPAPLLPVARPLIWTPSGLKVRAANSLCAGKTSVGAQGEIGQSQGMSQQPELTSPSIPSPPQNGAVIPQGPAAVADPPPQSHRHGAQRIPRWLERAELFLRVLLRMYIGLAVCYAPWSRLFWDQNPLFLRFPSLSQWASYGAVRGIISGLGLLNLWIAFREAVRHRDG